MARRRTAKPNSDPNHKLVNVGLFVCGLFAVAYGLIEGFVFESSVVVTATGGTFTMDKLTSSLIILGGLVGIGFAVWAWFTGGKKHDF